MKRIKSSLLIVFTCLLSFQTFSQTETDDDGLSLNSGTIDSQFEFVIQKSNKYQDYKVVKKTWLYTLKAHTLDSLNAVRKDLVATQNVVSTQEGEISSLKEKLNSTQTDLDQTNIEKDNMSLFGLQLGKANYNILMWSIIGALLAFLLFFIYKFNNSNAVTKEANKNLADIEEEFEEHRRSALEREQKVRRQLQDELNKHK
ncbi:tRNA (guanine-N1)-methyltransferase [Tamlana sp. 2_MG-2023]|uniref:tRNA (guanine-N1)-methyltransferase n=1 Tax=unclassified Tamlana TaxID=2614803 RepID=UPI0026E44FC6|nr:MULTISPECIES: tRNA (guanine-N1)-methyltransferase [unclassified Tamlana]MDO6759079.1 tRNA (guanine-N1)-methyltransferase [Tamlana sp. 2_MG-2023]MDO6789778.1 tRNA (guanine-N1)-methyltransferase [Tamlana sp. 1_MG-2023]